VLLVQCRIQSGFDTLLLTWLESHIGEITIYFLLMVYSRFHVSFSCRSWLWHTNEPKYEQNYVAEDLYKFMSFHVISISGS
jgi:hypothetical protein